MGLINGMKDRLTRDDSGAYDEGFDDGFEGDFDADGAYDDTASDDALGDFSALSRRSVRGGSAGTDGVLSFDAYDPANFENVTMSTDVTPRVASYDSLSSVPSRSRTRSRSSRTSSADSPRSWSDPADPAFLDNAGSAPRSALDALGELSSRGSSAGDSSGLGSDFIELRGDPASRLEVVCPGSYADVEKIANAAKAGKSVVLDVTGTQNDLAKRILDFTFGVASALNLNVDKADERVFVISKGAEMLSASEREYLRSAGVLK